MNWKTKTGTLVCFTFCILFTGNYKPIQKYSGFHSKQKNKRCIFKSIFIFPSMSVMLFKKWHFHNIHGGLCEAKATDIIYLTVNKLECFTLLRFTCVFIDFFFYQIFVFSSSCVASFCWFERCVEPAAYFVITVTCWQRDIWLKPDSGRQLWNPGVWVSVSHIACCVSRALYIAKFTFLILTCVHLLEVQKQITCVSSFCRYRIFTVVCCVCDIL